MFEGVIEFPGVYLDEEGNEIWESPIVTGSGYEMFTGEEPYHETSRILFDCIFEIKYKVERQ